MSEITGYVVAPDAQLTLLRLAIIDLIDKCTDFATEVAEAEAHTGCMSLITIQQHLQYLRTRADALGGRTLQ